LALGVLIALATSTARAGLLEIDLTLQGGAVIPIVKGGPLDTANPADPDAITVNTNLLNLAIAAAGAPQLTFSALGASSNNPGVSTGANLTQTGTATLSQGSGPYTFTVDAFQSDFNTPVGNGSLQSSASHTFTNTAAGDTQTFQSWFDQTNTNAKTTPSPLIAFVSPSLNGSGPPNTDSGGTTAALTPLGAINANYSLVNETVVTITASPGATSSPIDQFQGSTVVTATAVPEPTSFVAMFTALPLIVFWRRHRRRLRSMA